MKVINLLPRERQKEIRFENVLKVMVFAITLSVFSFALVFLAQFGTKYYLAAKARQTAREIQEIQAQVNQEENAKIKGQIKEVNDTIGDFRSLSDAVPKWSRVLKAFAKLPPEGVRITSFSADANTKLVTINGFSPTRELVIELYNNLKADEKEFYNVDYPLENVAKARNINFHFSFYIKDELIK